VEIFPLLYKGDNYVDQTSSNWNALWLWNYNVCNESL